VAQIAGENGQPFWFQMSGEQRGKAGSPWGPANPQALDRYSYVLNNPLKSTDPTGHCIFALIDTLICAAVIAEVGGVIVTAVVGTVAIIAAYEVGGAIGRAQASNRASADTPAEPVILESRYRGDKRTAGQVINDDKKGGINSQFPTEYKDKTPDQIYKDAKAGVKKAQTAKKLLDSTEYDKDKKK